MIELKDLSFTYPAGVSLCYFGEDSVFVLLADGELLKQQREIGRLIFPEASDIFDLQSRR